MGVDTGICLADIQGQWNFRDTCICLDILHAQFHWLAKAEFSNKQKQNNESQLKNSKFPFRTPERTQPAFFYQP